MDMYNPYLAAIKANKAPEKEKTSISQIDALEYTAISPAKNTIVTKLYSISTVSTLY